jgi:hypothetical protein
MQATLRAGPIDGGSAEMPLMPLWMVSRGNNWVPGLRLQGVWRLKIEVTSLSSLA